MSNIDSLLLDDNEPSFPLDIVNVSSQVIWTLANESLSTKSFIDKISTINGTTNDNISGLDNFSTSSTPRLLKNNIISEVLDTSSAKTVTQRNSLSTKTAGIINRTLAEVTFSKPKPEVIDDAQLEIAQNVVIGACVVVVFLACVAIILRIVMPYIRPKLKQKKNFFDKDSDSTERKISGSSSGFASLGTETDSHSHSSGSDSTPSQDWSEVSSDQTRSTDADEKPIDMETHFGKLRRHPNLADDFRGSSSSLPTYLPADREKCKSMLKSNKSSPTTTRHQQDDDLVSVISSHSLEPLHMEDNYRNRWDDQWDPYCSLPRGNLSHHSHPSESRLSLSSKSTTSVQSNAKFPTPSREQVHRIHMDKERRYQTKSSPENRKEKTVRMFTPTNR